MSSTLSFANAWGSKVVSRILPADPGITPLGTTRERFSVSFYLVAMLFIVLDVETLFLIPWAAVFREFGIIGFVEITAFLAVLGVGLVYAWKKGALEWD